MKHCFRSCVINATKDAAIGRKTFAASCRASGRICSHIPDIGNSAGCVAMTVLSVARAASMPTARLPAAVRARASRQASPRVPPRLAGAARVALAPASATSATRSASAPPTRAPRPP